MVRNAGFEPTSDAWQAPIIGQTILISQIGRHRRNRTSTANFVGLHTIRYTRRPYFLAGRVGIEPTSGNLEVPMLPLHQRPKFNYLGFFAMLTLLSS